MQRGPLPEHAPTSRFLDTPEPNETFFAKGNGVRAGRGGPRARPVQWDCFSISPEFDETLFRQGKWSRAARMILPERGPAVKARKGAEARNARPCPGFSQLSVRGLAVRRENLRASEARPYFPVFSLL